MGDEVKLTGSRKLRSLLAKWESDATGCRRLERQCGRQEDWHEALRFRVAAETMEVVVRELRAALSQGDSRC